VTTLAARPNPVAAGRTVTLTATVTPPPTAGTVAFSDGGTPIRGCGAVAVSAGRATCQVVYPNSQAGTHRIVARYSGAAGFSPSTSAPLKLTVLPVS
jgi:hypothetical protein